MAINMQGSWTVAVKSKEDFEPAQRFIIADADTGNGTYDAGSTTSVDVTGDHWTIRIQIRHGAAFVDEHDRITFPVVSGGHYRFDIQADSNAADPVWDDLVLTCSTPVTFEDFLIYGNVSYYNGCFFNPCTLPFLTIESRSALAQVLQNPILRVPVAKLYPDRLRIPSPRPPGPTPDPPFVPLVVPLRDTAALPAKVGQVVKRSAAPPTVSAKKATASAPDQTFSAVSSFSVGATRSPALADVDQLGLARFVDRLFLHCSTGPLPGVVLRFQEYDRTNAELAGGAYTGTGDRETLGVCATDVNGNYIFRFSRTLAQYFHEAAVDVAPGEDLFTQSFPDVIAQLLAFDPGHPAGYSYESAPYWNVPLLKQINICVPQGAAPVTTACQGANAIQAIGNIFIGAPQASGARVGYGNTLGADGKITTNSALLDTPAVTCAAWVGLLDLFACFTDHSDVTQYTIEYKPHDDVSWHDFQELYLHPEIALIAVPGYSGTKVGPFTRALTGGLDGDNPAAQAYDNIENNPAFVLTHRNRKAWISSGQYPPPHMTSAGSRNYGPVDFRIEGYNALGAKVAGADDTITLYIDNNGPDFDILSVSMAGQDGGDCALFNLHGDTDAPMTVVFRANQLERFLNSYNLGVRKGNIGGFAVTSAQRIAGQYNSALDSTCAGFEGTFDDLTADANGYVTADLVPSLLPPPPTADGRWLEPDQPFCTFAVQLSCTTRITNGYTSGGSYGTAEYLLGIQAS